MQLGYSVTYTIWKCFCIYKWGIGKRSQVSSNFKNFFSLKCLDFFSPLVNRKHYCSECKNRECGVWVLVWKSVCAAYISWKQWECSASKYAIRLQYKAPYWFGQFIIGDFFWPIPCLPSSFKQLVILLHSWECISRNTNPCLKKEKTPHKFRAKIILYVFDMGEMSQMLSTQLANTWHLWRSCNSSQGLETNVYCFCVV